MKKFIFLLLFFCSLFSGFYVQAQSGIINTIAGNGTAGYSGDGGAASSAMLRQAGIECDRAGNLYIADMGNNRIRKVDTFGIITTIAGTGTSGYSGDGGPATLATLYQPSDVTVDNVGNVYIADGSCRIRKINHAGIISTVAGIGTAGFSGDGGPATAAKISGYLSICVDTSGNLYIGDAGNSRVRKVSATGIITTIGGNGTFGYTGDGGPATNASFWPTDVACNNLGDVFICDMNAFVVRKINPSGFISTYAGGGGYSATATGLMATSFRLSSPKSICVDNIGNLYITDSIYSVYGSSHMWMVNNFGIVDKIAGSDTAYYLGDGNPATTVCLGYNIVSSTVDMAGNAYVSDINNSRVRKITSVPTHSSDSFSVSITNGCTGVQFLMLTNTYSSIHHIKTYYGDGTNLDTITYPNSYGEGYNCFFKLYTFSGTYSIKHVLYCGTIAVDSISYSHNFSPCQNFDIKFYFDANGNCIKDSAENYYTQNVLTEIDSNGFALDTFSSTSGFSYLAYGNPGDIYSFSVLETSAGTHITCPSTSVIYDALSIGTETTKYFAVNCTVSNFDLKINASTRTGRHRQEINFIASNTFCTPETSVLTFKFSPNYNLSEAAPTPSSVIGNTITWDISSLSYMNSPKLMYVHLERTSSYLTPGDTIMSNAVITPTIGDYDSTNNHINRVDTVKSSYDPNEMEVAPSGCISGLASTKLQYTIQFENTGNDTAHNIYVMDTLSDAVAPHSIRIVAASHTMNTSRWYDTSIHHNIVKFEFPGINLLDSSHHGFCDGMVLFTINTNSGISSGTTIFNRAGIYFDINPVVMTNTVQNITGCNVAVPIIATLPQADLYPNPATDELIIKTDPTAFTNFAITNIMGQEQLHQTLTTTTTKVNISNLAAGLYYVTFKGEGGELVKKLVKIK